MKMSSKIGKDAIPVSITLEMPDRSYKLDGHAIPVEGIEEIEIGSGAIPLTVKLEIAKTKFELSGEAKPES